MFKEYLIDKSKLFHDFLFYKSIAVWKYSSLRQLAKSVSSKSRIINYEGIDSHIQDRSIIPSKTVCHIIGSGWSLNESKKKIQEEDFVIGFNQAALSGLKFDLYFVEFGGYKVEEISRKQVQLIEDVVKKQTDLIIFKNIDEERNDPAFIKKFWGDKIFYMPDVQVPMYRERYLEQTMKYLYRKDNIYLKQFISSVLASICLAKNCGFKEIVLHGVDFGGAYFFDVPGYHHLNQYRPDENKNTTYKKFSKDSVHVTSRDKVGVKECLPILQKLCREDGVTLMSASEESPLSKILPLYSPKPKELHS